MSRPKRLHTRYPLQQRVQLCRADGSIVDLVARDISRGGLFLVTEQPAQVFEQVRLRLTLPGGEQRRLQAEVVHIVSAEKAAVLGIQPGMGLQFKALDQAALFAVQELIETASAVDPRRRIARRKSHGPELPLPGSRSAQSGPIARTARDGLRRPCCRQEPRLNAPI